MTPKRRRLALLALGCLAVLFLLGVTSFMIVQTTWFADYARSKIVSSIEDSTGAKVEIGRFRIDASHLTIFLTDLVVHGTERAGEEPLASIKSLELRLKLFSGLRKALDLKYLRV